jgi:hypothetical protein
MFASLNTREQHLQIHVSKIHDKIVRRKDWEIFVIVRFRNINE